jgi:predicted 3-demethylubiquinone-9 3-methyltransferase (glyoxalase superfamily)
MTTITPFLWYDKEAEEAANFYCSIFKDAKILSTSRYGEAGPGPKGSVMTIEFELKGQRFTALNGGPQYKFTEAVSLSVSCDTRAEVDEYWAKLSHGGEEGPCGWLKDRYGLSWQIVPKELPAVIGGPDRAKAANAMKAMFKMKKLDIEALKRAYAEG